MGEGDVYGQAISHVVASGMGGIRTAGDLVARMQLVRRMRLSEAKDYVAAKLGVAPEDLSDPVAMVELRRQFGLGGALESGEITGVQQPIGLEAKFHIAELLEIPVASVERFAALTRPRLATQL